ncbi:MAG: Uma2 family endonuclease [Rubricoccaceae bacterium]
MPAAAPRSRQLEATRQPEADQPFRWTRERYDLAVEAGVFTTDDKIELLDGEVVAKMPQNTPHRTATLLVAATLREVFGGGTFVQEEKPIALSETSVPEPDVAVVRGSIRDHVAEHPGPVALPLLVEVADTSLIRDRFHKASLYAEAEIAEYWIVNLKDRVLEVHRDPAGDAYRTKTTLGPDDTVSPLARPQASISVAGLLP